MHEGENTMLWKINCIRACCYVLAFVMLGLAWYFATEAVNDLFDVAESVARATARSIAKAAGSNPAFAEVIAIEKMHAERTLILSAFMLIAFTAMLLVLRIPVGEHLARFLIIAVCAHLLLAVAWIVFTDDTSAWYARHYEWGKRLLRHYGQHKLETLLLRVGQLHGLAVIGEAMAFVAFIATLFRRHSVGFT